MELFSEEIKFLILNLTKKKDTVKDESELEKINKRIAELSSNLKNQNQLTINETFLNVVTDVDSLLNKFTELKESLLSDDEDGELVTTEIESDPDNIILPESEESYNMAMVDTDSLNEYISEIRTIKDNLNKIVDSQRDLQNVENPINFYFDYLVLPVTQIQNQVSQHTLVPTTSVINQASNIVNTSVVENQPPKSVFPQASSLEFANKRTKVQHYIRTGNFEQIYLLLKGADMKVVTHGMEDLLAQVLPSGSTVLDEVLTNQPVTDDYHFLDDDVDNSPTQIHMSDKAQAIFTGQPLLESTDEAPKANAFLNKIKNIF